MMIGRTLAVLVLSGVLLSYGAVLDRSLGKRAGGTATVTLSAPSGSPSQLASGFIYGIPDTPHQIPSKFYEDMGYKYGRAGGAQTPTTGWLGSVADYNNRFQSALSNYHTTREYNGRFELLLHDLWGADGGETETDPFPGDNGNWTFYDQFLETLVHDIYSNGMTPGLDLDIWNEADGTYFWKRPQSQYLDMWGRGFATLRKAFGNTVKLVGPSFANPPGEPNSWWDAYLSFIASNGTIPDLYSWHSEAFSIYDQFGDPAQATPVFEAMLSNYSLPRNAIIINEYGSPQEQQPGGAAWYISRLERLNIQGLRGNWNGGGELHDFLASLLGKTGAASNYSETGTGYWPNGEWRVYQYYATEMTGIRLATTGSADRFFDVFATFDEPGGKVKMLAGPRVIEGTWYISVNSLSSLGLPRSGTLAIEILRFDYTGGIFGDVGRPVNLGVKKFTYFDDTALIPVTPVNNQTAYAFEISCGGI